MVPGLLVLLLAGHVVGSVEDRSGRDYTTYDRDYYAGRGGYDGYDPYGRRSRSYDGYGYGECDYGYPGYGYGYRGYGGGY